jgi:lysophospholipase L1-like esterase
MKKLVLFGDSLFAQVGKHRLIMLEQTLPDYDVYNCAVGGWDTNDAVAKAPYISKLEPDVLVISLGTNDAAPWKQVPLEKFTENIPKIFNAFNDAKIVYFLPTPVDEVKIANTDKRRSIKDIKVYHDAAKSICEAHGVAYIDSYAIFKPLLDSGQEYHIEDGVHFNDFAYEIIATELAKVLSNSSGPGQPI